VSRFMNSNGPTRRGRSAGLGRLFEAPLEARASRVGGCPAGTKWKKQIPHARRRRRDGVRDDMRAVGRTPARRRRYKGAGKMAGLKNPALRQAGLFVSRFMNSNGPTRKGRSAAGPARKSGPSRLRASRVGVLGERNGKADPSCPSQKARRDSG